MYASLIIYELDELERKRKPKYEAFGSPEVLFSGMICVAGDYTCVIPETDGHVSHLTCIDLETAEGKVWPEVYPSMNCQKMSINAPEILWMFLCFLSFCHSSAILDFLSFCYSAAVYYSAVILSF